MVKEVGLADGFSNGGIVHLNPPIQWHHTMWATRLSRNAPLLKLKKSGYVVQIDSHYIAALIFNTLQLKTLPALQGLFVVHVTCTSFGKFSNCKSSLTNERVCPLGADGL